MTVLLKTPPHPFLGSLLIRSVLAWGFIRGLVAASAGSEVSPAIGAPIIAVVVGVVWLDQLRRREVVFLRNLGVGFVGMLLPTILAAATLELVVLLIHVV